jgi:uncharacterized protein (DUF934 family)
MRFIKDGKPATDGFARLADDEAIPPDKAVLLSAARLLTEGATLNTHRGGVGVVWPNSRNVADLVPFLARLDMIALVFPHFRDGRAYSQARLLRERHRFEGELRATGQVLRDQFLLMLRAGFDAFEVTKDGDADHFGEAIHRYSRFYQGSVDRRPVIATARQTHATAPVRAAS